MRTKIIAGNWKMNKTMPEGIQLVKEILSLLKENKPKKSKEELKIILGTPFILLNETAKLVEKEEQVFVAAQNCYTEERGAFTGETSVEMIKSAGAEYVIIGHSERRAYFNESHEFLAKKVNIALKNSLIPIFCCGEPLKIRQENKHFALVKEHISESLFHLNADEFSKVVIAYEPVWAIGTGVNATPQQAQEMHEYIRSLIKEKYGNEIAANKTILYGGSCNAQNAKELFTNPDVDGGLIGGASLKAGDFVQIINSI